MQINKYEFQAEIFNKVLAGDSEESIRQNAWDRKQELRHLVGADNPSDTEFKKSVLKGIGQIVKDKAQATKQGPLAESMLTLWGAENELTGRVLRGLSSLSPVCMDDLTDIRAAYDPLLQKVDRENLQEADLLLDGEFSNEIELLYGVKIEEPSKAEDASEG